jgi:hypothetical protein
MTSFRTAIMAFMVVTTTVAIGGPAASAGQSASCASNAACAARAVAVDRQVIVREKTETTVQSVETSTAYHAHRSARRGIFRRGLFRGGCGLFRCR